MAVQAATIHEVDSTSEWIDEALGSTLTKEQQLLLLTQIQDLIDKFQLMQIFIVVEYLFICSMCSALVCYLRRNRHIALKGDTTAARKLMLPAFEPLLWLLGLTTGIYALLMLFSLLFGWFSKTLPVMLLEVFYSVKIFVFTLVMVFLLQKSVSFPALRRSVIITLVLATYTMPAQLLLTEYVQSASPRLAFGIMSGVRSLVLVIFACVALRPPARASKRTLREYCYFMFTYFALQIGSGLCFYLDAFDTGFTLTYVTALWAIAYPVVIWRVLRADTEFWRGMGQRAVDLQTLFRQKHSLNERISSQGLHVLIEMHRKLIIDFAHLELKRKIGVGASAVVFNGLLHPGTPVAVKVYTPVSFTEETVAAFSHEAALCGALHHPNIVNFYGMCVYPPTICLVSELCHGTLGDVTCAARVNGRRSRDRQQMLLNLSHMLDAARAVAYLHSFSPPFLHRDIKPANFLVDSCGVVKLTDFGESRSLARSQTIPPQSGDLENHELATYSVVSMSAHTSDTQSQSQSQSQQPNAPQMTVKGTVDYMAQELIQGRAGLASYAEAADVYSLAMTMWDVLHPGAEKYPTLKNNHLLVFAFVVEGKRPKFDLGEEDDKLHPALREIIETAWDADPRERPSAAAVVSVLEGVQEELLAVFASELLPELRYDISVYGVSNKPRVVGGAAMASLFPGELIATRMQDMKYVQCTSEAVRLGSAFMDAGLLHHQKHAHTFENARTTYFFDEDNIRMCQPLGGFKNSVGLGLGGSLAGGLLQQQGQCDIADTTHSSMPCRGSSGGTSLSEDQDSLLNNLPGSTFFTSGSAGTRSDFQRRTGVSGGVSSATGGNKGGIPCRCRKLGQRLELPRAPRGRRLRRKFKSTTVNDNVLTARLLEVDTNLLAAPDLELGTVLGDTLDGFDAVGQSFRAA